MNLTERLRAALAEDLGPGDLTTEATVPAGATGRAEIVAKSHLVVSGQGAAKAAFAVAAAELDAFGVYTIAVPDGEVVAPGTVIGTVNGSLRAILVGERLALNLLMRMCGIATHTRRWLQDVGDATFRAVDTRKTTPLWRDLEKAAVLHGGGHNHRFGLFDGVLVKENHIASAGGVAIAVERARAAVHHLIRVECEVQDEAEMAEALDAGADGVLLDNMDDATIRRLVARVRAEWPHAFVEASGNMTPERLASLADAGLDVISLGGLIHQATWADLSLKVTS